MSNIGKIFVVIQVWLVCFLIIGCRSENPSDIRSNSLNKTDVGDNRKNNPAQISFYFEKSVEKKLTQIEFNGKQLEPAQANDRQLEFRGVFENDGTINRLTVKKADGKVFEIETRLEPLRFAENEPFIFYRLKANRIKLSRVYTETEDLWLGITDNYIGGFKEIAEFNNEKNTIIIPEAVSKRMSVGEAKIELFYGAKKPIEIDSLKGSYIVTYLSELKLKVVK